MHAESHSDTEMMARPYKSPSALHENVVKTLRRERENMEKAYDSEKQARINFEAEADSNSKHVEKLDRQVQDVKAQNERLIEQNES